MFNFNLSVKIYRSIVISIGCSNILAVEGFRKWDGLLGKTYDDDRSLTSEIPFYSDYWEDFIVVHNEKPDRAIFYEIVDEYDNILIKGSVSKENSAQITISVSDLPDNGNDRFEYPDPRCPESLKIEQNIIL